MGLGKTIQLLSLIAAQPSGPTLLVCPMSLVGNWQREAARFTPGLRVHVHHGADRLDRALAPWPRRTWSSPATASPPGTRPR